MVDVGGIVDYESKLGLGLLAEAKSNYYLAEEMILDRRQFS